MIQLSVLDLAYIGEGFSPADALTNALELAQHAEAAGFTRFWLADTTTLLESPVLPLPCVSAMSLAAPKRSASVLAALCCPTTHRW
jgi:alkanesulfonate monooxygenase SsuD/methylene tetrahydromethanopterin reductase-like flavin-dependent oxidoreductase (luciferase family)